MGTEGARVLLEGAGRLTLQTGNLLNWGCQRKKCPATPSEEVRGEPGLPFRAPLPRPALGRGARAGRREERRLGERSVRDSLRRSPAGPGARHGQEGLWLPSDPLAGALGRRGIGTAKQFRLLMSLLSLLGGRAPRASGSTFP